MSGLKCDFEFVFSRLPTDRNIVFSSLWSAFHGETADHVGRDPKPHGGCEYSTRHAEQGSVNVMIAARRFLIEV